MKKIKFWVRRYFGFSQRETNGFILLLLITVLAIAAPFLFNLFSPITAYNPTLDRLALDSLASVLDQATATRSSSEQKYSTSTPGRVPARLHRFNPNTSSEAELIALGISRYAAGNMLKYRSKAGRFRYKEQLQRIYGMPEALYLQLYPYIDLPAQADNDKNQTQTEFAENKRFPNRPAYKSNRPVYSLQPFDINTADTSQLKKIRGIGDKLSERIVKFRDKLGGFSHSGQLSEVYGLSPEVIDSLHKYTFIQPTYAPRQLMLNTATLDELRAHPYVGFNLARLIVAYRTQHGAFRTTEELKNIKLINEETYLKLKPYLSL